MKKKVTIISITILLMMVFSGCTENENTSNNGNNNNYLDQEIGIIETFSVNSSGGDFSLFDDKVRINVTSQAVDESINITVETINNPVEDPDLIMFSCLEFGPDGTIFEKPINLIIRHDETNLPEGVNESDIKIYVLNGDAWEIIEDSYADETMHWSVASISHFSKVGGAAPAPSTNDNDQNQNDVEDDEENNGSAQYWFKADIYHCSYTSPRILDWDDDDDYTEGVSAYWDPVSYAQYYQIKFVFNGNYPSPPFMAVRL